MKWGKSMEQIINYQQERVKPFDEVKKLHEADQIPFNLSLDDASVRTTNISEEQGQQTSNVEHEKNTHYQDDSSLGYENASNEEAVRNRPGHGGGYGGYGGQPGFHGSGLPFLGGLASGLLVGSLFQPYGGYGGYGYVPYYPYYPPYYYPY